MSGEKYIIGIDEAGRGPLAGPVAVGVVCIPREFYNPELLRARGIRDSKKLSEKKREEWYDWVMAEAKARRLLFAVSLVSNTSIDTHGIVPAIKQGIASGLERIESHLDALLPSESRVLLDGGLKAPESFSQQKTIIKGDEKEPIISLASIMAKVTRDRHMGELAKKYPEYGFEIHKGYGTARHYEALKNHGASSAHRTTFLKNIEK